MSINSLENVEKRKKILHSHPWARVVKPLLANKIKHSHNSVNNPMYPSLIKNFGYDRIQIVIMGDQVTKEFIYCVNLVKGLHKYRSKQFDAPVIRG